MQIQTRINRTSYIPLYIQVVDALRGYIEGTNVRPGQQLPGEVELCRMFGVSRTVIRQALVQLERNSLIIKQKGRGTFVAEPKLEETWLQKLIGFHQDYEAKGYHPHSEVLKRELIPANAKIASRLRLSEGEEVLLIKRLRFVDKEPLAVATTYTPHILFPKLLTADLSNQSLYRYLQNEYGIEITRGHRAFEAVLANQGEAELLKVREGAPMLLLESVSYLVDGSPFEYYKAIHRGDRSRFELEVSRANTAVWPR